MTSPERFLSLANAIRHVTAAGIPGAIVECGVWRGGSMMAAALTLIEQRATDRELFLFDTFAGMTPPTHDDVDLSGRNAEDLLARHDRKAPIWAHAELAEVRRNMESTGYPSDRIRYVVGPVEETLPAEAPERISVLRLDSDWYTSTRHELIHLYPKLSDGGVLIIDDYGHWKGSRRAVDEYLAQVNPPMLLHRVDYTCREAIKRVPSLHAEG
jgi:O-methyltransferase